VKWKLPGGALKGWFGCEQECGQETFSNSEYSHGNADLEHSGHEERAHREIHGEAGRTW
jgi:hypothetical protein